MDFLSYREIGHIGGPSGKGHIRALDIGGIRRYREISHVWRVAKAGLCFCFDICKSGFLMTKLVILFKLSILLSR